MVHPHTGLEATKHEGRAGLLEQHRTAEIVRARLAFAFIGDDQQRIAGYEEATEMALRLQRDIAATLVGLGIGFRTLALGARDRTEKNFVM
ncbi:hypothetical protein ACQR06_27505 [Bradyrhizobium sp. HKCCYLRH1065]